MPTGTLWRRSPIQRQISLVHWFKRRRANPTAVAGLTLWLKASAGLYQDSAFTTPAVADADPVGGWQDQSGAGNHFVQATAAKRPTLRTGVVNGRPVVRFDGVDDFLSHAGLAGIRTLFLTAKHGTTITLRQWVSSGAADWVFATSVGDTVVNKQWQWFLDGAWRGGAAAYDQAWHVSCHQLTTTGARVYHDGGAADLDFTMGAAPTISSLTALGAHDGGAIRHAQGDLLEVVGYTGVLTAAQINLVAAYLAGEAALTWSAVS